MTCPSRSVTFSAIVARSTLTMSFAVLKPTAFPPFAAVTVTFAVRASGSTAHDASSGSVPSGPTRTRITSSRSAVISITAEPLCNSMPLSSALLAVTRSSASTEPGRLLRSSVCRDTRQQQGRSGKSEKR